MKGTVSTFLYTCLAGLFSVTQPIGVPKIFDQGLVDCTVLWSREAYNSFYNRGDCHLLIPSFDKSVGAGGLLVAIPLPSSKGRLIRLHFGGVFFLNQENSEPSTQKEEGRLSLACGMSSRQVCTPEFIFGWYFLRCGVDPNHFPSDLHSPTHDGVGKTANHDLRHAWNAGIELIFPQRQAMISIHGLAHPKNLMANQHDKFYMASAKLSLIKPYSLTLSTGFSGIKYPQHKVQIYADVIKLKGRMPIRRFNFDKWATFALGINYRLSERSWRDNITADCSIQVNFLQQQTSNSQRDYLRMPIDRPLYYPALAVHEQGYESGTVTPNTKIQLHDSDNGSDGDGEAWSSWGSMPGQNQ